MEVNRDKNPDSLEANRVLQKGNFTEQRMPKKEMIFLLFINRKIVPATELPWKPILRITRKHLWYRAYFKGW